ncbi:MAG: hypothetical protein K6C36_03220 [Clostridia bacterium]|nr:hypothetical protein [Clostridia bacterium]
MRKMPIKLLAVALSLVFVMAFLPVSFASGGTEITSPYDSIDWDEVRQYKTALHQHTNASDGDYTMAQMLSRNYQTGYEIVASTDHGIVNYSWDYDSGSEAVKAVLELFGKSEGDLEYLDAEGTLDILGGEGNGEVIDTVAYTLETTASGDILSFEDGTTILRIPDACEQNALSNNAHVNSWFSDYTRLDLTTYEDAIAGVKTKGGLCVINHPGEYTKAKDEFRSSDAYNLGLSNYKYFLNYYSTLISENYGTCLGIDMNSKGDSRTRFDRKLWDELLERFSANGQTVYGIASSDAHNLGVVDTGCVYLLLEEKSIGAVKEALANGAFFPSSTCIGNKDELEAYIQILGEDSDLAASFQKTVDAMDEKIELITSDLSHSDDSLGIEWTSLDANGLATADRPMITKVTVSGSTITLDVENAEGVRWVSGFETVGAGNAFDVSTLDGQNYVRAEVVGEGGVTYTEPFIINASANAGSTDVTDGSYTGSYRFIDSFFSPIVNFFRSLLRKVSIILKSLVGKVA